MEFVHVASHSDAMAPVAPRLCIVTLWAGTILSGSYDIYVEIIAWCHIVTGEARRQTMLKPKLILRTDVEISFVTFTVCIRCIGKSYF